MQKKGIHYLCFHVLNLSDKSVVASVTAGIIHMRKSLEPWVKSCHFVEEVMTSRISVLQVFTNGSLDFTHMFLSFGSIKLSTVVLRWSWIMKGLLLSSYVLWGFLGVQGSQLPPLPFLHPGQIGVCIYSSWGVFSLSAEYIATCCSRELSCIL